MGVYITLGHSYGDVPIQLNKDMDDVSFNRVTQYNRYQYIMIILFSGVYSARESKM